MAEAGASAPGAGDATTSEAPAADMAALQRRVEALEDSLLRAKADNQNLQRRAAQERIDAVRYANAEFMRGMIGVVDDLERALAAAGQEGGGAALADGVRLVYENLLKALRLFGCEPIEALHRPFDPHCHEALMQQPSEEHAAGTVIAELAKGYRLRERTLRPAKVVVAAAPVATAEAPKQEPQQLDAKA